MNSFDNQQVGRPLVLADSTLVPMFEARDDDGGVYGDITFEINSGGENVFHFKRRGHKIWKLLCKNS